MEWDAFILLICGLALGLVMGIAIGSTGGNSQDTEALNKIIEERDTYKNIILEKALED